MCAAPATGEGYREVGPIHSAIMTGTIHQLNSFKYLFLFRFDSGPEVLLYLRGWPEHESRIYIQTATPHICQSRTQNNRFRRYCFGFVITNLNAYSHLLMKDMGQSAADDSLQVCTTF